MPFTTPTFSLISPLDPAYRAWAARMRRLNAPDRQTRDENASVHQAHLRLMEHRIRAYLHTLHPLTDDRILRLPATSIPGTSNYREIDAVVLGQALPDTGQSAPCAIIELKAHVKRRLCGRGTRQLREVLPTLRTAWPTLGALLITVFMGEFYALDEPAPPSMLDLSALPGLLAKYRDPNSPAQPIEACCINAVPLFEAMAMHGLWSPGQSEDLRRQFRACEPTTTHIPAHAPNLGVSIPLP